ncbi:calcium-binding protein [Sphingomonas sp. KR3-1]|uniref:calcium-binding protein n=1 Tax=Sphingomonas sp. KR3-1 TaxID=3156611 RepID=UPI0032B51A00
MLKPVLLATSILFAVPAIAQETPAQDNTQPTQNAPAPDQTATPVVTDDKAPAAQDQATTAQAAPAPAQPVTQPAQGVAQETTPAAPAAQPTGSASATPAATQEQVAQAVGRDFGTYDKDGDGKLNATEFAAWMGNLRKAAEPTFQPGTPEATTWTAQAFTSADTDKSASVNKQELTVFLTPKQPG